MNDDLVKKDYFEKIQKIQKLNKAYYLESTPLINDREYDSLKKQKIIYIRQNKIYYRLI